MRYNEIKEKIMFKNEMRGFHSGQKDLSLRAYIDGKLVGWIDYVDFQGNPSISMIEIEPQYRRRGVARGLIYKLQNMYPDREIDWGMTTDEGGMLYNSLKFKEIPVFDVERYNKIKKKFDQLTTTMEQDWSSVTDKQRRDWYRLEDIIDRIERSPEFDNQVKKIIVTD